MSKDLIVLVADRQQEKTIETLLQKRTHALGIRAINYDIFRHPQHDPGVYHQATNFLRPYQPPMYRYALVIIDQAWDGAPTTTEQIHGSILQNLYASGWEQGTCEVIVINPELEAWVWVKSPHVPNILRTTWEKIYAIGYTNNFWVKGESKPNQPKELLEAILEKQRRPRSAAIYQKLAEKVSLKHCEDEAFLQFQNTLKRWFGA